MAKDSIGVIFGKTGSLSFQFAVSDSAAIHRTDYVKVWHESDGWVLSQAVNITRSSDVFQLDNAVDAAVGGNVGNVEEKIIGEAMVIGYRDKDGLLRAPRTPFSPGDKVFRADEDLIRYTLGLLHGDIYLGLLDGQDIRVNLDSSNLVQKHCSILARTGSGKSYTAAVIMEELLEREIPLVIIDPHGEYATLKYPNDEKSDAFFRFNVSPRGYADVVTIYTPANKILNPEADRVFRLNGVNLTSKDLAEFFSEDRSPNQMGILFEAISALRADRERYTLDDIIFMVGQNKSKVKWNVIRLLEMIRETEILSDKPTMIEELVQQGRASIVDMKGIAPDLQSMVVAKLCSELFEARKMNRIPPCMLVVEEAHNFCPERGYYKTASMDIMRTIASEGRKFGLGLMVISQRPARIDKNVLSQCNTQIIMKVTNPNDLRAISKGLEGISGEIEEEIKRLPPGVAMVVSSKIERPILVDVRIRKSKHGGESAAILREKTEEKSPEEEAEDEGKAEEQVEHLRLLTKLTRPSQPEPENSEKGKKKGFLNKVFGYGKKTPAESK